MTHTTDEYMTETSTPIQGAAAESAGIRTFRVYIDHENRALLHRLALEQGYIGTMVKVSVRGLSQFVMDIVYSSCKLNCTPDLLFRGNILHIPKNAVVLNVPYELQRTIPQYFHLDSWDQVLVNIAQRKIEPTDGYPRIGKIEVIQEHIERANSQDIPRRSQIGQIYSFNTDLTTQEINHILPVLKPDQYIDNRPDPTSEKGRDLDLRGGMMSHAYRWRIPSLLRESRRFYIPDAQVQPILDIGEYWHIIPLRKRAVNVRMCIVLESIAHNLLKPKPE